LRGEPTPLWLPDVECYGRTWQLPLGDSMTTE
jgi:hypothetical protein